MKKIHIISIFLIGLLLSCSTSNLDQIDLAKNSAVPNFTIDDTKDGFIDKADPASGEVGFALTIEQGSVASATVKVVYNSVAGDRFFATVSADVSTYPQNVSLTVNEIVDLFPQLADATDLTAGDIFSFFAELTLTDGTVIPGYKEDGPNYSDDVITSPLFTAILNYTVACGLQAPFTGQYALTDPAGNWGDQTVTVVSEGPTERSFEASFFGFDGIPFNFSLICDQVIILQTSSGLGCGGPSWEFGPDSDNVATFDLTDDSTITLQFLDNNKSACGGGPGAYQMTLTKL
ncbi:hypothetical protein [Labilibaculum euxinus]